MSSNKEESIEAKRLRAFHEDLRDELRAQQAIKNKRYISPLVLEHIAEDQLDAIWRRREIEATPKREAGPKREAKPKRVCISEVEFGECLRYDCPYSHDPDIIRAYFKKDINIK